MDRNVFRAKMPGTKLWKREGYAMQKVSKIISVLLVCLLMAGFTPQANALLTGPVSYEYADTGSCGDSLTYTVENGILWIQGTGDMYDCKEDSSYRKPSWDPFLFTQIVIESGVTSIGDYAYAFAHANGCPLTSVQLPDTLKRIGESAFSGCNNLAELVLPEGLTTIGDGAFSGDCNAIRELNIPRSVTSIGRGVWDPAVREDDPRRLADDPSAWAKAEIDEAFCYSLMTQRTCIGYQQKITRIQIAELAANMVEKALDERMLAALPEGSIVDWDLSCASEIPISSTNIFQDTNDYMVLKAASAGIVTGRGAGAFAPDGYATREEIAVILCRAAAYVKERSEGYAGLNMEADLPAQYADAAQVSAWAGLSVAALTDAGILTGTSDTTLSPQNQTSVQEAIVLTLRLYKHIVG